MGVPNAKITAFYVVSWAKHPIFGKYSVTLWACHDEARSPQVLRARVAQGRVGRVLKTQGTPVTVSLAVAISATLSEIL